MIGPKGETSPRRSFEKAWIGINRFAAALIVALIVAGTPAHRAKVSGRISNVGTHGPGHFSLGLDGTIPDPARPNTRLFVPATHRRVKRWLAVAIAALSRGALRIVGTQGYFGGHPIAAETDNSYFHLTAPGYE
jgi:hypothetical protein